MHVINPLIWPDESHSWLWWDGRILCDIEAKLIIGIDLSVVGATAALFRQLSRILDPDRLGTGPSRKQRIWARLLEISLCIILPVLVMPAHYIVQEQRYCIYPIHGCTPCIKATWLSFPLIHIWPPILSLVATTYGALTFYRLIKHKRQVSSLVASGQSRENRLRFVRLLMLASAVTVIYTPLSLVRVILYTPRELMPYSWDKIHPPDWSELIWKQGYSNTLIVSDWIAIVSSILCFICLSWTHKAVELLRRFARLLSPKQVPKVFMRMPFVKNYGTSTSARTLRLEAQNHESTSVDDIALVLQGVDEENTTGNTASNSHTLRAGGQG